MIVLVTGASGFIGARLARRLAASGHTIVAAVRDVERVRAREPQFRFVRADFTRDLTPDRWLERLDSIDAVVNTVGIFRERAAQNVRHGSPPRTDRVVSKPRRAPCRCSPRSRCCTRRKKDQAGERLSRRQVAARAVIHAAVRHRPRLSRSGDARATAVVLRWVVIADWLFTATTVVLQPATGFYLWWRAGFPMHARWLVWSLVLFVVAGACWVPVVWLQLRMRDLATTAAATGASLPERFRSYFRIWTALGVPAFVALVIVFYLMVAKPT